MSRLFWKFFLFLFVAQITAVIGVSVAIWLQHRHEAIQNTGVETSPSAHLLVDAAASTLAFGGEDGLRNLLKNWQDRSVPKLLAIDTNGKELLQRGYTKTSYDTALLLTQDDSRHAKQIKLSNGQSYLLFVPDNGHKGRPAKHAPEIKLYKGPSRKAGRFPLMPLLGGVVVSLIFATLLAWYFSKPINTLRSAFEQASHGKLDVRVADAMGGRRDELSDLGHDFDAMASRLENLLQSQTKLLHHTSHELRSPLARIQMAIGLLKQSPQKITDFVDRITLEANRMDGLVGELLTLSRLEAGTTQIKKETIELNQLMHSIIEDAQFEATSKNMQLCLSSNKNHLLQGQPDLLYRAFENVIRNAIKYGPNDSEVHIHCDINAEEKQLHIAITDQGPGVDEIELEDIFKPFVRGASSSQTIGHGVGLAISKQVIEAHGGKVVAKNIAPKGFCVEISLPWV